MSKTENIIMVKSFQFAVEIIRFCEELEKRENLYLPISCSKAVLPSVHRFMKLKMLKVRLTLFINLNSSQGDRRNSLLAHVSGYCLLKGSRQTVTNSAGRNQKNHFQNNYKQQKQRLNPFDVFITYQVADNF